MAIKFFASFFPTISTFGCFWSQWPTSLAVTSGREGVRTTSFKPWRPHRGSCRGATAIEENNGSRREQWLTSLTVWTVHSICTYMIFIYIDISLYLSVYLSLSILVGRHLCQCGASRQQKPTSCRYDTYKAFKFIAWCKAAPHNLRLSSFFCSGRSRTESSQTCRPRIHTRQKKNSIASILYVRFVVWVSMKSGVSFQSQRTSSSDMPFHHHDYHHQIYNRACSLNLDVLVFYGNGHHHDHHHHICNRTCSSNLTQGK